MENIGKGESMNVIVDLVLDSPKVHPQEKKYGIIWDFFPTSGGRGSF